MADTSAPPPSWSDTLKELLQWAQGDSPLKLAHVQGPRASGKSTIIPLFMWKKLTAAHNDQLVVFVTWTDEVARIAGFIEQNASGSQGSFSPCVIDYGRLLLILERNLRDQDANGPQPASWDSDQIIPDRTLFILDLIPQLPADFCLSMATLSQLALHRSTSSRLRILTVSPTKAFRAVLDVFAPAQWANFRLSADGTPNPEGYRDVEDLCFAQLCHDERHLTQTLQERVAASPPGSKHLVMFFEDTTMIDSLEIGLGVEKCEVVSCLSGDGPGTVPTKLRNSRQLEAAKDKPVTIYKLAHGSFSGVCVDSTFSHAHIVCSSFRQGDFFSFKLGNMVQGKTTLSVSERLDLVSWGARAKASGVESAYVYAPVKTTRLGYAGSLDVHGEWSDVAGRHLMRTIYGLICLIRNGLNIDLVGYMTASTSDPPLVKEMIRRLVVQGLIKVTTGPSPSFQIK